MHRNVKVITFSGEGTDIGQAVGAAEQTCTEWLAGRAFANITLQTTSSSFVLPGRENTFHVLFVFTITLLYNED